MAKNVDEWVWEINLKPLVGRSAYIETRDGIHREGRISDVFVREVEVAGHMVPIPESIELNGDKEDLIPFERVLKVDVG